MMFYKYRICLKFNLVCNLLCLLLFFVLSILVISGCGLRDVQTGSIYGLVTNDNGDVVAQALVYSIQKEYEKVYTGSDGVFYLSELAAGNHTIIVQHPNYKQEVVQIYVKPNETIKITPIKLLNLYSQKFFNNIKVEKVSSSTAVISWDTYKELLCEVEYGETINYGFSVKENFESKSHKITITNLKPETVYHFRIKFTDNNGLQWYSYDHTFKTLSPDAPQPPTSVSVRLVSYGSAKIAWKPSNTASVTGYNVWRKILLPANYKDNLYSSVNTFSNNFDFADWQLLTTDGLDKDCFEYTDISLEGGNLYIYAVTAYNQYKANSQKAISNKIFMPGYITKDAILTYAQSPYILYSDIIVSPNVTLTVEPGVEFYISQNDLFKLGNYADKVEFLIYGRLNLTGSENKPIKFMPLDSILANNYWAGITILPSNFEKSSLSYVWLSGCKPYAIFMKNAEANLENLYIKLCYSGISLSNVRNNLSLYNIRIDDISSTAVEINNCRNINIVNSQFSATTNAIHIISSNEEDMLRVSENYIEAYLSGITGKFSSFVFKNNVINTPFGTAINIQWSNGHQKIIDHCTINAKIGIHIASGSVIVENNLIVNLDEKGDKGIWISGPIAPVFNYNNIFGFLTPYSGCSPGIGANSYPPDFVGGKPFNWQIISSSPLKRADKYGSEIGRYGKSYY